MSKFNSDDMDELTRKFMALKDKSMNFSIERETVQEGLTFSAEAFEGFLLGIQQFISTRLARHWEDSGAAPTVMTVTVITETH